MNFLWIVENKVEKHNYGCKRNLARYLFIIENHVDPKYIVYKPSASRPAFIADISIS